MTEKLDSIRVLILQHLVFFYSRYSVNTVAQDLEFRSPRASLLWDKWRYVWMLSWERQRRLHDHMMYLKDMERVRNFSWDDWRKRVSFHWK